MKIQNQHRLKLHSGTAYKVQYNGSQCIAYGIQPNDALLEDLEIEMNIQNPLLREYIEMIPQNQASEDYLIFKYIEGDTIQNEMLRLREKQMKLLPEDRIIEILKSILDGLFCLHKQGTLGRCFKTSNIILNKNDMTTTLMEIGFFPQYQKDQHFDYYPPELKGKKYGLPVDMWLLGVVAWELINLKAINKLDLDERLKKTYSSEFLQLIQQMLIPNQNNRLTFEQLYKSSIFNDLQKLKFYKSNHPEIPERVMRIEQGEQMLYLSVNFSQSILNLSRKNLSATPKSPQHSPPQRFPVNQSRTSQQENDRDTPFYQAQNFETPMNGEIQTKSSNWQSSSILLQKPVSKESVTIDQDIFDYKPSRSSELQQAQQQQYSQDKDIVDSRFSSIRPPRFDSQNSDFNSHRSNSFQSVNDQGITLDNSKLYADINMSQINYSKMKINQLVDIPFTTEPSYEKTNRLLELDIYRLGFLQRVMENITYWIENQTAARLSQFFLQKVRIYYIETLLQNLQKNCFELPHQQWDDYKSNSKFYQSVITQLPPMIIKEKERLQSLKQGLEKIITQIKSNSDMNDVIKIINKDQVDFDTDLKIPYRKVMQVAVKSILQQLETVNYKETLAKQTLQVICAHIINRIFHPDYMNIHFRQVGQIYGTIEPWAIESFIQNQPAVKLIECMQLIMKTYFQ